MTELNKCFFFNFQSQGMVSALEKSLEDLQTEHDALKLQQQKVRQLTKTLNLQTVHITKILINIWTCPVWNGQAAVTEEEKERSLVELQTKVTSLERRLQGNLSQDEHLQELLKEVKNMWNGNTSSLVFSKYSIFIKIFTF